MLNIERESKINANAHSMSRLTSLNESCKTQIPQPKEVLFLKSTLRDSHWIQKRLFLVGNSIIIPSLKNKVLPLLRAANRGIVQTKSLAKSCLLVKNRIKS
ncbi:hypothetical protein T01_8147 [Trichinella spiralis]|uniref:Uncharacterized protein n=1 Tax=Trichinella spiralis TaxID=6334 RepID=A0A0V1ARI8_TRISP|nr:hypothetical protein T01_8147 [Trichinella spiralis]